LVVLISLYCSDLFGQKGRKKERETKKKELKPEEEGREAFQKLPRKI